MYTVLFKRSWYWICVLFKYIYQCFNHLFCFIWYWVNGDGGSRFRSSVVSCCNALVAFSGNSRFVVFTLVENPFRLKLYLNLLILYNIYTTDIGGEWYYVSTIQLILWPWLVMWWFLMWRFLSLVMWERSILSQRLH